MPTAAKTAGAETVDALMRKAFAPGRAPRSDAYKSGVRALLEFHVGGAPMKCPHSMGTAQADAFYAGATEGRTVWSEFLEASSDRQGKDQAASSAVDAEEALAKARAA